MRLSHWMYGERMNGTYVHFSNLEMEKQCHYYLPQKSKQHLFFQNPWRKSTATILAAVVTAPSSSLVSKIKRDWRSPSWKRGKLTWEWGRSGTSQSTLAAPASRQNSEYSNTSRLTLRNEDWSNISGFRFPWHNFSKAQTSIFIMITFTF